MAPIALRCHIFVGIYLSGDIDMGGDGLPCGRAKFHVAL